MFRKLHFKRIIMVAVAVVAVSLLVSSAPGLAADAVNILRVSVATDGTQADALSDRPSISNDGRVVAFQSWAENLVADDDNGRMDVFVRDIRTGTTTRVSVTSEGAQGARDSAWPSISADGRYVAFYSDSTLSAADQTVSYDIYVHDRQTGQTELVSLSTAGEQSDDWSMYPSLSSDGGRVAFEAWDGPLVEGDDNGRIDVFLRDVNAQTTQLVSYSRSSGDGFADGDSQQPCISGNGEYVAFRSEATNLVSADENGVADVFLYQVSTRHVRRVSGLPDGSGGNGASEDPSVNYSGRFVAFTSQAGNLVENDTNEVDDVFVYDRSDGSIVRVSVASDGTEGNGWSIEPSISSNGRYVSFTSVANNLVEDDDNVTHDVFVHDRWTGETVRASVTREGADPNSLSEHSAISRQGRYVAFRSDATNLITDDTNIEGDVYLRRGCVPPCLDPVRKMLLESQRSEKE